MVLIDAVYINNGGGKVLLDYLIEKLEDSDIKVMYLLDKRIEHESLKVKSTNKILYLKASLINRLLFYRKNHASFSHILCFGNLPPFIKTKAEVFTYFHQPLFLKIPNSIPFRIQFILNIKTRILNTFKNNTDYFLVQSKLMSNGLHEKYNIPKDKIKTLPFYPPLAAIKSVERKENTFVYISSGTEHKNHRKLLMAFCQFYENYKTGKLILTVGNQFQRVIQEIEIAQKKGYPVKNIGFVEREQLAEIYQKTEYLIFPSLTESFGLGLIEAIEQECKVVGADLPYTYEVCEPSLVFDPESVDSIYKAFEIATTQDLKQSKPLIRNNIRNIIELLS